MNGGGGGGGGACAEDQNPARVFLVLRTEACGPGMGGGGGTTPPKSAPDRTTFGIVAAKIIVRHGDYRKIWSPICGIFAIFGVIVTLAIFVSVLTDHSPRLSSNTVHLLKGMPEVYEVVNGPITCHCWNKDRSSE